MQDFHWSFFWDQHLRRGEEKNRSGQREKVSCEARLPPSAKSMGLSKDEPSGLSPGSQNWTGLAILPHQSSDVSHPQKGMSLATEGLPAEACALAFPAPVHQRLPSLKGYLDGADDFLRTA